MDIFYNCPSDSCELTHSVIYMKSTNYSDVSDSCFAIDNVQESREYILLVYFSLYDHATIKFFVTCGGM